MNYSNQAWRFYRIDTGEVLSHSMHLPDAETVAANTPPDCGAVQMQIDHMSQRVQLVPDDFGNAVPVLVDYQPPAPADDADQTWAWAATIRRWVSVPTQAALNRKAAEPILAQLAELDAKLVRPAGEVTQALALGQAPPAAAVTKLQEINAEKAALREQLAALTP
ncbi:hypothetical protein DBR47_14315 [Paucibacter sp. KBW04]|uniref:hypothetical protein n=1 Tax=Paucibacter sp. KBW04 TaxID=2153361 RepID=UPI000F577BAD|nr:hypothetical protein [Paucibacter sp. KBW04]RQO57964.1 hypothetical protein DBR47_14315 [Paucibacter sp. KBW04]